jgi:site-specific DNA-methyltransferase (adenine-specific)
MSARVLVGDCLDVLPTLAIGCVDAVVTDPPYGLAFMGKAWDHGVPGAAYWSAALHVVKPGAYLLAFGGTRTFHRLACAIEDAGWELQDTLSWLYGSGFPKHKSKLKPGWEPIILARRPASKATPLNIDACRLPVSDAAYAANCSGDRGHAENRTREMDFGMTAGSAHKGGRWPANVVLDEDAAALLDAQSGTLTSGANPTRRGSNKFANTYGDFIGQEQCEPARGVDVGGASRFYYCAKASRAERDAGLTGEKRPLLWSSGTQSPGTFQSAGTDKSARNHHPTVKPLALMRWLCRLITPPGGTILDQFAGSGSTGCAAELEGFHSILVEREPEYAEIIRARVAHYTGEAA